MYTFSRSTDSTDKESSECDVTGHCSRTYCDVTLGDHELTSSSDNQADIEVSFTKKKIFFSLFFGLANYLALKALCFILSTLYP